VEELGPGLYESLITEGLQVQLDELAGRLSLRASTPSSARFCSTGKRRA
jgi:hypothetical protein